MKFNHEKWDRLLRQQQAMHKQYLQFGAEWEEAKVQAGKTEAFFIKGYDQNWEAMQVVNQDKKLSADELERRIEAIKSNWAAFTGEYGIQDGPNFQAALIRLYGDILTAKRLYERREQQAQIMAASGTSMGRLKEFAKRYAETKGDAFASVNESGVNGYPGNYQNGGDYA